MAEGFRCGIPAFGDLLRVVPRLVDLRIMTDSANISPPLEPLDIKDQVQLYSSFIFC
jgi:hypothetical protein